MKILEVNNLVKTYKNPNNNNFRVLDDITFSLNEGEVLGLVGESGSGKTTLGRTIIRLTDQDSGKISFDKTDISNLSKSAMKKIRKDMQIIFQDPFGSLNPRHSIEHIIAEPLLVHKYGTYIEIKKRILQLLDQVGLPKDSMKLHPHEFSGGQRQRIAIARAIALKPKFLIADEAVSALDVSIQSQILNLISDLVKEYNISMVFISHDLSVIRHISSNIAIMKKGKIVEMGNTEKVLKQPSHQYTKMLISAVPGFQSNF
jgi:ABC-type oligopeptide transport system ATPase subunit